MSRYSVVAWAVNPFARPSKPSRSDFRGQPRWPRNHPLQGPLLPRVASIASGQLSDSPRYPRQPALSSYVPQPVLTAGWRPARRAPAQVPFWTVNRNRAPSPSADSTVHETAVRSSAREPVSGTERTDLPGSRPVSRTDAGHATRLHDRPDSAVGGFAQPSHVVPTKAVLLRPRSGRLPGFCEIQPGEAEGGTHPERAFTITPDAPDQVRGKALRLGPSLPFAVAEPARDANTDRSNP